MSMNPELLKSRQAFLKRAAAQPSVSTSKRKTAASGDTTQQSSDSGSERKAAKKSKGTGQGPSTSKRSDSSDMKAITPTMSVNFGILAKIVDHMRRRHLEQLIWGLTLDEILEEISMFDLANKTQHWLMEVLPQNPRITTDDEGKFIYRPPYRLTSKNPRNGLLKGLTHKIDELFILKKHDLDGKGGVLLSDLADSIPNPEKTVERLGDAVVIVPTQINKRKDKVLFYNDPESVIDVDEEFKQLWRGVAVDHLDEKKIEDYLHKHGIDSMKDLAPKKVANSGPKRKSMKRKTAALHNEHLAEGVLKDYSIQ